MVPQGVGPKTTSKKYRLKKIVRRAQAELKVHEIWSFFQQFPKINDFHLSKESQKSFY